MLWRGDGTNRVAKSLLTLFDQVDAHYPGRDTSSDGTIGNAAHQATHSDHNPDDQGIVRALDITHDPAHGFDSYKFADFLREHWDDRVQYIISNGRIANIDVGAKAWRPYHGTNPHDHHIHISVRTDDRADDARPWDIGPFLDGSAVPAPPAPKEGHVLVTLGDNGPAVTELQTLLGGIGVDGYFGRETDAAVRVYQSHHGLTVDGEVGDKTWAALLGNAPAVPQPTDAQTSKGSWYSQFRGKYTWIDNEDTPNSAALGVPDDAQGVAMPSHLGVWYEVRAPNGVVSIEQVTDTGPSAFTGRIIDISAAAAERFGYSPTNFPTDSIFTFWPVAAPAEVASLSPAQQAIRYRDLRNALPLPIVIPPPPAPDPIEGNIMDDKLKLTLITEICKPSPDVKALQLLLLNQPVIPGVPPIPPVVPPVVAPPASSLGQNLLYGLGGSLISILLGMNGNIGLPFGPDMTSTGLFSVLGPLITGLFGLNVPAVNAVTGLVKPKT